MLISHMNARRVREIGLIALLLASSEGAAADHRPAAPSGPTEAGWTFYAAPTYEAVASSKELTLPTLAVAGRAVTPVLQRVEIFSPDAVLLLGDAPLAKPELAIFAGAAREDESIRVFFAASPFGQYGLVHTGDDTWIISSGPPEHLGPVVALSLRHAPPGLLNLAPYACRADELAPLAVADSSADGGAGGPCHLATVAIETDYEFLEYLFDGNEDAATAYIGLLIAATSEIYTAEVNTRMEIGFLRLWPTANDPWDQDGGTADQLFQYQDYWNLTMSHIQRSAVHFLSGRDLGGGIAYVGALCYPEYDYALSANLAGYFPYPLVDNDWFNWDIIVVAHEFGHIFGAPHTHNADPLIDGCGLGDCSQASEGTIMSYCHLCEGGLSNIALTLQTQIVSQYILPFLGDWAYCTALQAPYLIVQPQQAYFCFGQGFTLWVSAGGTAPLSYQWRKNGQDIPGATGQSYSVASASASDAGSYDVRISNECGEVSSVPTTVAMPPGALGDLNGDCDTTDSDLGLLLNCYGKGPCGDLDGDGDTDDSDLGLLLDQFAK